MRPEETIDFHIRWIWAKVSRLYNTEASKNGGTMSMGYVLLNIDKEGTPSTRLGPRMGMEPTSLSRTLKSMEDQGLILRKTDQNDKRMVRVFLTKRGQNMRDVSKDAVLRFNEYMRSHLDENRLNVFFEVMGEINQLLENEEIFQPKTAAQ